MTARALGSSSPAALLNPVKPPRGHHLNPPRPGLAPSGEPGPEDLPGTPRGHVQQTPWPRLVAHGGQVDDDGGRTCRRAWCGATQRGHLPHESEARGGIVDPEDLHAVEAGRVAGDGLLGPGQDCVVGGVPGDPKGACAARETDMRSMARARSPFEPLSGLDAPAAGQEPSCPAATGTGSRCRRGASRVPVVA